MFDIFEEVRTEREEDDDDDDDEFEPAILDVGLFELKVMVELEEAATRLAGVLNNGGLHSITGLSFSVSLLDPISRWLDACLFVAVVVFGLMRTGAALGLAAIIDDTVECWDVELV